MKRIIWAILVVMGFQGAMAQSTDTIRDNDYGARKEAKSERRTKAYQRLRLGLTVSPMLSWTKDQSKSIDRGKVRGGVEYGLLLEYFFMPNYGLSTGLTVKYDGGNLVYKDSLNSLLFGGTHTTDARFKFQYLTLPISLKLKTNQIGYFTYYGEVGLEPGFCVEGRVDAEQDDKVIYDGENFLKRHNSTVFRSTIFDIGLHGGAGFEYGFSEHTSLLVGVYYNNGFINVVKDGDSEKITVNNVVLRVGVLF